MIINIEKMHLDKYWMHIGGYKATEFGFEEAIEFLCGDVWGFNPLIPSSMNVCFG